VTLKAKMILGFIRDITELVVAIYRKWQCCQNR